MRVMKVRFGHREAAEKVPGFVYCGRAYGGFDESELHNPYRLGRSGTLPVVLQQFDTHLRAAVAHGGPIREALKSLTTDSVLGCWCVNRTIAGVVPWACHCDAIATLWYELFGAEHGKCDKTPAVSNED